MRKNRKKRMSGIMLVGVVLVLFVVPFLYLLYYCYKKIFYYEDSLASPYAYGKSDQTVLCEEVLDCAIEEFENAPFEKVTIKSDEGLKLSGRYYHVKDGAPLEIQCHGYKGNAIRDFCGSWKIAKEAGRNVLLIDERSHGNSEGHAITFGILERKDVLKWIQYVNQRFGNTPILLNGVSMGAATVLMTSEMELSENVKGIIADCPYDAPSNIIKKTLREDMGMPEKLIYPFIRMGGIIYGKFDLEKVSPVEAVKNSKVPILLIHGDADRFVPYEMSVNIHEAAPDKIEFHMIHGAGHALNYVTAPEEYTEIINNFTERIFN